MTKTEIHTRISYVKSGLRILGYAAFGLPKYALITAGFTLALAELLGVAEEIFGA